ncbi:hypothetical protein [Vibrio barjaei]|uniref:hypothetical protein n=1 Tax=Vibrio barjaei TaxID=1676683 RepID=UPI002283A2AF|nr:hypothetical protein [Vibrio barjaei]MCY9872329.1 hypothetical protein [Vibrio barjaei]
MSLTAQLLLPVIINVGINNSVFDVQVQQADVKTPIILKSSPEGSPINELILTDGNDSLTKEIAKYLRSSQVKNPTQNNVELSIATSIKHYHLTSYTEGLEASFTATTTIECKDSKGSTISDNFEKTIAIKTGEVVKGAVESHEVGNLTEKAFSFLSEDIVEDSRLQISISRCSS